MLPGHTQHLIIAYHGWLTLADGCRFCWWYYYIFGDASRIHTRVAGESNSAHDNRNLLTNFFSQNVNVLIEKDAIRRKTSDRKLSKIYVPLSIFSTTCNMCGTMVDGARRVHIQRKTLWKLFMHVFVCLYGLNANGCDYTGYPREFLGVGLFRMRLSCRATMDGWMGEWILCTSMRACEQAGSRFCIQLYVCIYFLRGYVGWTTTAAAAAVTIPRLRAQDTAQNGWKCIKIHRRCLY